MEYRERRYLGWLHCLPVDDPKPHTISDGFWCPCVPEIVLEVAMIIHVPMELRLDRNRV